jgi:hypothetical protein
MMSGIIHTLAGRVTITPLPPLIVAIVLKKRAPRRPADLPDETQGRPPPEGHPPRSPENGLTEATASARPFRYDNGI